MAAITDLAAASSVAATDLLVINQSGTDRKVTADKFGPYTSGTWTPDLKFGGANVGLTYSARHGSYVRIGDYCYVAGSITLSNKGSSTGSATLTGLPFTVRNTSGLVSLLTVRWYGMASNLVAAGGDFSPGTTLVNLLAITAAAANLDSALNSYFANTSILQFSGAYLI